MKNRSIMSLAASFVIGAAFLVPQVAEAQPGRVGASSNRTAVKSSGRSMRSPAPQASRYSGNRSSYQSSSRGIRGGGSARVTNSNTPRLGDGTLLRELSGNSGARLGDGTLLRELSRNNAQLGDGTLLRELAGGNARLGDGSLLRQLSNEYNSPARYRYKAEEAHADAYRDAAIANAVVGLVGIIADAATADRRPVYAQPVNTAPAGYWETQRVLVQEGGYESRRVLVPEQRDPNTGEIIEQHYEVRKRYVPPVYEETQVWVQR